MLIKPAYKLVRFYGAEPALAARVRLHCSVHYGFRRWLPSRLPVGVCIWSYRFHRRPSPTQRRLTALFNRFMLFERFYDGLDVPFVAGRSHRSVGGNFGSAYNGRE